MHTAICQSCGMPLTDASLLGTEKNGYENKDYCKYCYRNGEFTHPEWDLDDMRSHMMWRMEQDGMPEEIIERIIAKLPDLKRWQINLSNPIS